MSAVSPFHARTAEHNSNNAWTSLGFFATPLDYGDVQNEALAARVSAVMIDVSSMEDMRIHGAGAAVFVSAACAQDISGLAPGRCAGVRWCADGGGLRGIGVVSRFGEANFLLRSIDADPGWFGPAAPRFGARLRNATQERGLLMIAGPFAWAVLAAAGLEAAAHLSPGDHAIYDMGGAPVIVFRREPFGAYLLSCAPDDGVKVFDRLMRAGRYFGLRLAGQAALDILCLEAGLVIPHLDFEPARTPFADKPLPAELGWGPVGGTGRVLVGLEFDSDEPAAFAAVVHDGVEAGRTMRSLYSPPLKRAIALASLSRDCAAMGTVVTVRHCGHGTLSGIAAKVTSLPFLK